MKTREQMCRILRLELVVMFVGSAFGAWLAYGLGKATNFAVDGRLVHVEVACAVLGLVAGFTGARLLMPSLLPAPTKSNLVKRPNRGAM